MKKAYLITNIKEYGKFISFCIENDIQVWRTYWNEREKGDRCYFINWIERRAYYSPRKYWENNKIEIVTPKFTLNQYGCYEMGDKK